MEMRAIKKPHRQNPRGSEKGHYGEELFHRSSLHRESEEVKKNLCFHGVLGDLSANVSHCLHTSHRIHVLHKGSVGNSFVWGIWPKTEKYPSIYRGTDSGF